MICKGCLPWRTVPAFLAVLAAVLYLRTSPPPLLSHPRGDRDTSTPRKAVVVGATGATGCRLVDQLIASPHWSVTAIVRRPTDRHAEAPGSGYSEVVVPDLLKADASVFAGHDVLFNCLGTTRAGGHSPTGGSEADVGGPENFVNVEVTMTKVVSELAVKAGVKRASVVTAEGANADVLQGHDWVKHVHPLLYMRTLGEKEQATLQAGFDTVSIFRPGLLNRETGAGELFQSLQTKFDLGLEVSTMARSMVRDAETIATATSTKDSSPGGGGVVVYESNAHIAQASKL